jgi:hypothetical protein
MKPRFRVTQRGDRDGMCYSKDTLTGERVSLETKNRAEADRRVFHKNEALKNTDINHRIGMDYLSASDPEYARRTWRFVMQDIIKDKKKSTLARYLTALKDPAYELIADKLLVKTLPGHLLEVLRAGGTATNVYLRRFQNHAFDMDWLPKRILAKKLFPKIKHKEMRGIKWEEHCRIIARETNPERRDYYDLCYYIGGSQTDVAVLHNEDIDRVRRSFVYSRRKNTELAGTKIGPKAWAIIERRPRSGPLFPYLCTVREADRATEFKQRCDGLKIEGVTLHSYRYAWAERSADAGYPERYAQRALGQNSKIVHRAYAKKAQGELPSLEDYEEAKRSGKMLVIQHEAEVPLK